MMYNPVYNMGSNPVSRKVKPSILGLLNLS